MKNRFLAIFLIIAVAAVILYWPNKQDKTSVKNGPSVVSSFYPLYFLSKEIIGERGNVYNITPAGAEPHDYELTTKDRVQIEKSDLLVLNGGRLEPWGERIASLLPKDKVLSLSAPLMIENDPHVWLDPILLASEAETIFDKIKNLDPANEKYYTNNLAKLLKQIYLMDADFRDGLQKCDKQDIITAHNAFSYLARRYGFNQLSISGLSPDSEPTPQTLAEVTKFVKNKDIKYIFFESLVSPKLADTVARETGAKTLVLNPLEGLSGADLAAGKNFFTEMKNNLVNLRTALVCQ